nr:MAG TPA: hypothetical protein [Bacteriophage sp.]
MPAGHPRDVRPALLPGVLAGVAGHGRAAQRERAVR